MGSAALWGTIADWSTVPADESYGYDVARVEAANLYVDAAGKASLLRISFHRVRHRIAGACSVILVGQTLLRLLRTDYYCPGVYR